jgi:D-alanyl-D-alanine carboxypeptidase
MPIHKIMYSLLTACGLGLLGGCGGAGQPSATVATLDGLVQQALRAQGIPGLAAAIISSDRIQVSVAGVRKIGVADPISVGDRFHLGSNTKAMTATLAASLVESGVIGWNSTLLSVFPDLAATMRPEYQNVTLAQLLTHRGGIIALTDPAEWTIVPAALMAPSASRLALTQWLLQQAAPVAPGTTALYSNAGYAIATAMLERATGQSYETLLNAMVLQPLGVTPQFNWPAAGGAAQPWGHELVNAAWLPNDPDATANQFPTAFTPAGNVSLSVGDYAKFVQSHLKGLRGVGGSLSSQAYTYLHTTQGDYGLGWVVKPLNGVITSAHDGTAGTFYALAAIQPSRDRAVIVLVNGYSVALANAANALALQLLQVSP